MCFFLWYVYLHKIKWDFTVSNSKNKKIKIESKEESTIKLMQKKKKQRYFFLPFYGFFLFCFGLDKLNIKIYTRYNFSFWTIFWWTLHIFYNLCWLVILCNLNGNYVLPILHKQFVWQSWVMWNIYFFLSSKSIIFFVVQRWNSLKFMQYNNGHIIL